MHCHRSIGGKFVATDRIFGQQYFYPGGLGFFQKFERRFYFVGFHQGVTDGSFFGQKERVSHGPADEDIISVSQEFFQQQDLVAHFGAASDAGNRFGRLVNDPRGILDFALHQKAESFVGLIKIVGHDRRAGVGAVGGSKGVIHVNITQSGQFFGELRITLFFFGIKPGIFQQQYFAWFQGSRFFDRHFAHRIIGEIHLGLQLLFEVFYQVIQREFLAVDTTVGIQFL